LFFREYDTVHAFAEPVHDAYALRLIATGTCFIVFGLGGLLLGLVLIPLVSLLPGGGDVRVRRARALIRGAFRFFIAFMRAVRVLSYEFEGGQRLGRAGQLILANHPSLIDVVFLLAFTPGAQCIVKEAMRRNPFTRAAVRAAGYLSNQPTEEMVLTAAAQLQRGECLVMFPEGTRTRPGKGIVLQKGAANIAVRGARILTPVHITVVPTTLTKAEPWYRIPPRRPHWRIEVGPDLDLAPVRARPSVPLATRALNGELARLFGAVPAHVTPGPAAATI
jgi:1-acyl-sn-glycerol-3-phosphate acyltransferase